MSGPTWASRVGVNNGSGFNTRSASGESASSRDTPITVVHIAASMVRSPSEQFNVNNLWVDQQRPNDYDEVNHSCQTKHWVDLMRTSYSVFVINTKDVLWIRTAATTGGVTGVPLLRNRDDLADFVQRRGNEWSSINHTFVRSESCSLKRGCHGVGPYDTVQKVAESLSTPEPGHDPLDDRDQVGLKLYRWEWQALDRSLEVRVFVWHGDIVAISQQHLYSVDSISSKDLEAWSLKVLDFWTTRFRPSLSRSPMWDTHWVKRGFTLDIGCTQEEREPYFIEINPHGAQYAAGSALFHWVKDADVLHGKRLPEVEVRWVVV